MDPRLLPMGERAVLVETGSVESAHSLAAWVRASGLPVTEIVPGARTVLLDGLTDPEAVSAVVADWPRHPVPVAPAVVTVPVTYDGPDLLWVARQWGLSPQDAVAAHTAPDYVVAFCGFAPGFPYLAGLPAELALPRLDTPRTRVPAGSVAVADSWTGLYPSASPGGWRLLGRTSLALFDPDREQPALLAPGTRVRLEAR